MVELFSGVTIIGVLYAIWHGFCRTVLKGDRNKTDNEFRNNVMFNLGLITANSDLDRNQLIDVYREVIGRADGTKKEDEVAREILIRTMLRTGRLQRD